MAEQQASTAPSRARKVGRIALRIVVALVGVIAAFAGFVFFKSERAMSQTMHVEAEPLSIPSEAETIARGARLANTYGCLECHGADAGGHVPIRAMPVMEVHAPNLTKGGPTADWSGRDWARAVRHGVRPDGSLLLFMPTRDFRFLDDADLGAIVAYLQSVPAVTRDVGRTQVGPVGRLLYVTGELPLLGAELVDHDAPVPPAPPVGPTAEYGRYLAAGCTGCHGETFSGGKIPGTPPEWPAAANITPDTETGIGNATEEQFIAAVRSGTRRRGGTIDPMFMPWRQFSRFTDDEVKALYAYLRTVPAKPAGGR